MDLISFPINVFCYSRSQSRMLYCILFLLSLLWSVMVPFFPILFRKVMSCICDMVWFIWRTLHSWDLFNLLVDFLKICIQWSSLFVTCTAMGFSKSTKWCIYHHSTIQTSFITPKIPLCSPLVVQPPYFLKPLVGNDVFCLCNFNFSRMS